MVTHWPSSQLPSTFYDDNNLNKYTEENQQNASSSASTASSLRHTSNWSDAFHSSVTRAYRKWAHFVVANPIKIIIFCFILTGICATKMAKTKNKNNIHGYTPYGARALYEFDVRDQFFNQSGVGIRFFVLILPKNGTNMLDENILKETSQVDSIVQHNLTIFNRINEKNESFAQICRRFCTINEPVNLFYIGWKDQQQRLAKGEPLNSRIQLDYPFSTIFGREINIQPNFFGIEFANYSKSEQTKNITNIQSVGMIVLLYRAERIGGWSDEDIANYEMSISNYFKNYKTEHIRVLTISTSYANVEIQRSGNILRSYVGIGLVVMIVCSVTTTMLSATFMRQFSIFKLPIALFACLCPFMASGTALGILFFLGVRYGSILGVTPFLILAIGIDDAFLMIHSWQLASTKRRKSSTNSATLNVNDINGIVADQLAEVLEETGPAILISALTNITADVVGSFTGSPEITLLCVGNIASIIVDFFYQITLFTAVLVLCARWELRSEAKSQQQRVAHNNQVAVQLEAGKPSAGALPIPSQLQTFPMFNNGEKSHGGYRKRLESMFERFVDSYVHFVSNIFTSMLICALWIIFLLVCLNAMLKFEINLTTKKLFPPDSPLLEIENYREDKVLPFYTTAQLFINNPGDLSNETRRHRLNEMIEEMEHLPYAYPAESSLYFVRTYETFENFMSEGAEEIPEEEDEEISFQNGTELRTEQSNQRQFLADLDTFINWPEFKHWPGLINYHVENDSTSGQSKFILDSFMATVAYHGEDLKDWYKRALMLRDWRQVVDNYAAEFNVTVLHDDGLYLDLLENMPTDIWQSALATLLCMAAICALFMSNLFVVCVTTGVIASIFVETLGLMALMGMTMDPVVMAAVIISIGFSVDIPAHVSYHFHTAKWTEDDQGRRMPRSVEERVRKAFSSVGFPALQASICANICIAVLLIVPLYMAQVFVRVMCTCLTLCTIHSLLLLPTLFTLVARGDQIIQEIRGEKPDETGRRRPSIRI